MGIRVHFEYPEEDNHYTYEGVIQPTPEDILEYLNIKSNSEEVMTVLEEMLMQDLIDEKLDNFVEFIKEKYYEIKRYE